MIEKRGRTIIVVSLALSLLIGLAPAVLSSGDGTKVIKERQKAMEAVRDSMMALVAIAKKEQPFDAAVVKKNAAEMAKQLEHSKNLFPEGSDQGEVKTWAKSEIWSQPDGFAKSLEQTLAAANAMQEVTDEADFGPALGNIGNGCKMCHDMYRLPKE
jgi:cytochrome c556